MQLKRILALGVSSFLFFQALAQETSPGRISPKELSIPPSPVFDLLGVTPSQINHMSDIKDVKVDWSFKSWKLNPNLAIQAQPIWEMLYNRKNLSKYQQASSFMRRLSSTDVSIGSVLDENNDRRIGFAVKLNLVKGKDPLMESSLYTDIVERYKTERHDLDSSLRLLRHQLDTMKAILDKPGLRSQLKSVEESVLSLNRRQQEEINVRAKIFADEHWNASWLDLAFGRVYTYKTDSAGSLKSLRLNRNTGWAGWINGGWGIGSKGLFTGLFRITWYEEQLDFLLRSKSTGEESVGKSIAENTLFTGGFNLRYGGPVYNFFAEFLYERKGLKTPAEALAESFRTGNADLEVLAPSVKWTIVHPYTFSLGGDWRVSKSVIINYGMRFLFSSNWSFETFTPVASISCMMR